MLPLLAHLIFGPALHWDVPELRGFNFRGGLALIPELAALTLALSVYTSAFIAEIIRAGILSVPHGQHEAARSLGLPNPVTLRQVIIPQAMRVIHSAADQPVSEYHEKLVACRRYRLSGYGVAVRGHCTEPDRPGYRDDCDHDVRLPHYQPVNFATDEPL